MSEVIVIISGKEMEERKEVIEIIKKLSRTEKERLKGFLEGLRFAQ